MQKRNYSICLSLLVSSEEEQETAVQRMLNYVNQMPSQETFQPPALPFVSFATDETNVKYHSCHWMLILHLINMTVTILLVVFSLMFRYCQYFLCNSSSQKMKGLWEAWCPLWLVCWTQDCAIWVRAGLAGALELYWKMWRRRDVSVIP